MEPSSHALPAKVPRVAITYCTQCRWMLRAAYFGQELLSTFQTGIGEIALIPATGGIFTINLTYVPSSSSAADADADRTDDAAGGATLASASTSSSPPPERTQEVLIWDRKTDGGFPEAKVLKQRIRDYIDPRRDLGHSDRPSATSAAAAASVSSSSLGKDATTADPTTATAKQEVTPAVEKESADGPPGTRVCEDCA